MERSQHINAVETLMASMSLQQKVAQMIQGEIKHVSPDDVRTYGIGSVLNGGGSFPNQDKNASLEDWVALADAYREASLDISEGSAGIPLLWGTDAVHGHNNVVGATIFPHNIGLGAANDPELIGKIGRITSREVAATGIDWIFAPTVAVPLDDRWGRTYEGYSDRPEIVREYAGVIVEALQSEGLLATAKHFIGDGGTDRGIDQGDTRTSLETLLATHGQGYYSALEAGVTSVMASFNSWNGSKIHGDKFILNDLLRDQLGFRGFVISDWNGHGQIPGCTNASCAQAINAGVDMIMAPEDWKSLLFNTLEQVENGEISRQRIDEAVRRILIAKAEAGLFDAPRPSERAAPLLELVGSPEHRSVAREAARKSLVMLKNNDQVLPVAATASVLVAGAGADSIEMQTGGWTITWQGTGNSNAIFPGATSIFAGLREALQAGGGKAVLSPDGSFTEKPDVAIVVFGETPYAEGQGDVHTLAWQQEDPRDLRLLQRLKEQNIPVVAVFLSGRALWMNAHLNASDAFVAAWLPGSEGAAIADMLVANADGTPRYDFTGRLSFDWPNADLNAVNPSLPVNDILFEYGYGLSYTSSATVGTLSETAVGKPNTLDRLVFGGTAKDPWRTFIGDAVDWEVEIFDSRATTAGGNLTIQTYDRLIQEDSVQLTWLGRGEAGSQVYWRSEQSMDMTGLAKEQGYLVIDAQVVEPPTASVLLRMDCEYPCTGQIDITEILQTAPKDNWQRMAFPLSCFVKQGAELERLSSPAVIFTEGTLKLRISEVAMRAELPSGARELCP
ncbi:MAG: exo 1,3/1,4-beta-D-glucan glucohydrolase [Gammaproteobacteria bacterium]